MPAPRESYLVSVPASASATTVPKGFHGNIERTGDEDWIAVTVDEADVEYRIRVSRHQG